MIEPVNHSEWAAPIVPVPKADGTVRICGDYKVTINPILEIDQYPLLRPEDLFSTLSGGQKFTKMDLSHAYQQILLDEESCHLVTVNTHRGLYRYNRLATFRGSFCTYHFSTVNGTGVTKSTWSCVLYGRRARYWQK